MNNKPLDIIKELIDNPENMTPEQVGELLENSLQFFNKFTDLLKNNDEKKQEEVLKELFEFNENLQEISNQLVEKTGLSKEDLLKEIMKGPSPEEFTEEQRKSIEEIGKTMSIFNASVQKDSTPEAQKKMREEKRFPEKNDLHI